MIRPIEEKEDIGTLVETHYKLFKHLDYLQELTNPQVLALDYAYQRSRDLSNQTFKQKHYPFKQMKPIKAYLKEEAPLIIHVNLDKTMRYLCEDLYYRNQFETNMSGGTLSSDSRKRWEHILFPDFYANSDGFERVKYGVLNVTNHPFGELRCHSYGDSYLKLLNEVKERSTLTYGDSGHLCSFSKNKENTIVTFHFMYSLIQQFPLPLFEYLLKKSEKKNETNVAYMGTGYDYIEAQIHGSLKLDRDIESIHVHSRHKNDAAMVAKLEWFRQQYKCPYIWIS